MIICPMKVKSRPVSLTTSPVTQVALVAVNSASTTCSGSPVDALGSISRPAPATISTRKLATSVFVGFRPVAARLSDAMQTLSVTSMIR